MHKLITLANLEKYNVNIQKVIDNKVPTKVSAFENDSNYVSLDAAQQMIDDALPSLEYCTNDDILRLFDTSIPDEPETPGDYIPEDRVDPEQPESTPVESIGEITDDNSIVIDETQLENGTYTLRYIDAYGNIIYNFNEITSFEINN